jgi:hypothetical protein
MSVAISIAACSRRGIGCTTLPFGWGAGRASSVRSAKR